MDEDESKDDMHARMSVDKCGGGDETESEDKSKRASIGATVVARQERGWGWKRG